MVDENRTFIYRAPEKQGRSASLIILDAGNKPTVISLQGNMTWAECMKSHPVIFVSIPGSREDGMENLSMKRGQEIIIILTIIA